MSLGYILGSIIMMTMLGLAVGNYATSLTFRLPRGLKIANDPPYCDSCRQYLAPRDLFPFFSWVVNHARCRFCGAPIPALYAFVELACALVFNAAWFAYWPDQIDQFILVLGLGVFVVTLISLHIAEKRLFPIILVLIAAFIGGLRILEDQEIFTFASGAMGGLALGLVGWGIARLVARRKLPFPDFAILAAMGGASVGLRKTIDAMQDFLIYAETAMALMLVFWLIGLKSRSVRGSEGVIAISIAMVAPWLISYARWHKLF